MGLLSNLFGGGITKSIENVALEYIQTDVEKEEAKTVMLKALDPNGAMRRNLSVAVTRLYVGYMCLITLLILMSSFGRGEEANIYNAIDSVTDLFLPLTSMFSLILSASFGVNMLNTHKEAKLGK